MYTGAVDVLNPHLALLYIARTVGSGASHNF